MRYFYCLLFGILMFMGCSKDTPKEESNVIMAKFSLNSPTKFPEGYYNEFDFAYSKSIAAKIEFKVKLTGVGLDTVFNGEIEESYDSKPIAFGDPAIIGINKAFHFASEKFANKIELISITSSDPKYKFKMLPPRNLTD